MRLSATNELAVISACPRPPCDCDSSGQLKMNTAAKNSRFMIKQVCVKLPTSADNVALSAFAAARRAAARLLLTTAAVQQSINISWLPGPQQQTRSGGVEQPNGTLRRTPDRCIDPNPHSMRQCLPTMKCGLDHLISPLLSLLDEVTREYQFRTG